MKRKMNETLLRARLQKTEIDSGIKLPYKATLYDANADPDHGKR